MENQKLKKKMDSGKSQLSSLRYLCHFLELGVHPVIRLLGKVNINDSEDQQQSSVDRVPVSVSEWLLGSFVLILTQTILTNTETVMLSSLK